MLSGLELLGSVGAVVPELRALHDETLRAPLEAGDVTEVQKRLGLWLTSFPDDIYALRLLAENRWLAKRWTPASVVCDKILRTRSHDAQILKLLAICAEKLRQWERAATALERYLTLEPQDVEGHALAASIAFERADQTVGVAAAERCLELIGFPDPSCWDGEGGRRSHALGTALRVLHRFQQYERLVDVAGFYRSKVPDSLEALGAEAVARLELGDAAGAEPLLRQALADPNNARELGFRLGISLAKQRKHREAARQFAGLLEKDPWFVKCYYQLGLSLSRLGRSADAELMFGRSRELADGDREIRRARELDGVGKQVDAAVARARGYSQREQLVEAEAALREPRLRNEPGALLALSELYLRWLRIDGARATLRQVRGILGPEHPEVAGNLARADWAAGHRESAVRRLEALCREPGTRTIWRLQLARALIALGRPAHAVDVLTPSRRSAGDREISLVLAQARIALAEPKKALQLLDSISRGDKRWDRWQMSAWLARAQAEATPDATHALQTLETTPASLRGTPEEMRARLAVLERLAERSDELASVREAVATLAGRESTVLALEKEVASTGWKSSAAPRLELAHAYRKVGRRAESATQLRWALVLDPRSVEALRALARLQTSPAVVFDLLRTLRQLAQVAPDDADTRSRLADLQARWLGF